MNQLDEAAFWQARSHLTVIRDTARARMASPWAVLGCVLARCCVQIGPHVVLPPIVGGYASLNTFWALTGDSGGGKGAADAVGREVIVWDAASVPTHKLGSGQGIDSSYTKQVEGGPVQYCDSVLFNVAEIDQLAAHAKMSGSTVMATLREVYSGEALGAQYASQEKRRPVKAHHYRAAVVAGVQPARSGILLDDADGGTPQRWVWLPTNDPDAVADADMPPEDHIVQLWATPHDMAAYGDKAMLPGEEVPRRPNIEFKVCDTARSAIVSARLARLRAPLVGTTNDLDGHALLTRLKVAALLALLDRGQAEVTEEDWQLAGAVMAKSDETREMCRQALANKMRKANIAKALEEIERADVVNEASVKRVAKALLRVLARRTGWVASSDLRRDLPARDREFFGPAIAMLLAAGHIDIDESERATKYRHAPG